MVVMERGCAVAVGVNVLKLVLRSVDLQLGKRCGSRRVLSAGSAHASAEVFVGNVCDTSVE